MANSGQVTLRGRFRPGSVVALVRVQSEATLRAQGGQTIDRKKVDSEGLVRFTHNVDVGGRYFVVGQVDGGHLEVRARGREVGDESELLAQAPIQPERQRLSDGSFIDEPREAGDVNFEGAPHVAQSQVSKGTVQRSDTARGSGHPHDPQEQVPHPRQEDVKDSVVQMSATETGQATPQAVGPQRQEDVPKNVWQRSSTPTGQATVLPTGGPVKAQREKESSEAKAKRGTPGQAAAHPLDKDKAVSGATQEQSEKRHAELLKSEREAGLAQSDPAPVNAAAVTSGHDAMGQPLYPDAAAAAGVEPAKKPDVNPATPAKQATKPKRKATARKPAVKKATASKSSTKSTTTSSKEKK